MRDSKLKGLSPDRKFAIAYNAILQSATIFLYGEGTNHTGSGTTLPFLKQ
jgi:hypothetical protein